mmetsp:Transcript_85791/g.199402  ORF Transcript_85791/g.199402 Transcript_85791/m.199402 type:complete len:451 (+) Transcript_85791:142-1494(+)
MVLSRLVPDDGVHAEVERSTCPFSFSAAVHNLPFDINQSVYLELPSNEEPLFTYVCRFVSKSVKDARSIRADMGKGAFLDEEQDDELLRVIKGKGKGGQRKRKREVKVPAANIGLGWHSFDFSYKGAPVPVVALLQRIGKPVGDGPSIFSSLVLFVNGSDQAPLLQLCQEATEAATQHKENRVSLWRFEAKHHFWTRVSRRLARSIDSVVMEETVKKPLLDDISWFVKEETQAFYAKHGIPYHRCYLFHGEPGTGKTSFIYALAGHVERNLCFIQMDKSMTDDTFRSAMSTLPSMSMVVLEDVDALFTNHRESANTSSSLSFSGFLNCLDGLGAPNDVIICLTTNHPDRLDPAVLRPGRVDMKVAFKTPSRDVAAKYFLTFYPGAETEAKSFAMAVGGRIAERRVSMAQLQHFFLACHRQELGAEKAVEHIKTFPFEEAGSSGSWSRTYG